jgi:predicted nucleic acid-binding Zn ribbon protein
MTEKKPPLTPLKEILAGILQDDTLPFNPDDAHIWRVWDKVVGPAISKNAQPMWIKDGRLRVKVSDPIWLQELGFAEASIKDKLNRTLGRRAVSKIEFKLTFR